MDSWVAGKSLVTVKQVRAVETGHSGQATVRGASSPWLSRLPSIKRFSPSQSRRPSQSLQLSAQQLMPLQTFAVLRASHSPLYASVLPPKKSKTLTFTVRSVILDPTRQIRPDPCPNTPLLLAKSPSCGKMAVRAGAVPRRSSQVLAPLPYLGSIASKFFRLVGWPFRW